MDVSDAAMRKAIEDHNEISRIITEIGDFRKSENPNITGYEFHVINLVSQVCPHYLIKPYLEETLEELKTREPEEKFPFRARVVLVGSEVDDPEFTKLIETCGAMVVADRYCFGSFPSREQIEICLLYTSIGSLDVAADEADAGSGIFPLRKLYHLRRDVDARDIRAAPDVIRYQNSGAAGHVENAAALSDSGVVEDDVYLPVAAYPSRVPAWGAAVKEFYYVGFIYHLSLIHI